MLTQGFFLHPQLATYSCVQPLRISDGHQLLSIVLDVLSSWSFDPLPFSDLSVSPADLSGDMLFGINSGTEKHSN